MRPGEQDFIGAEDTHITIKPYLSSENYWIIDTTDAIKDKELTFSTVTKDRIRWERVAMPQELIIRITPDNKVAFGTGYAPYAT